MTRLFINSVFLLLLTACGSGSTVEERVATAKQLHPTDVALNEIYQRSCRSCHTLEETGAPLVGDKDAWSDRYEKGSAVLVDNVINGFGGMPPFGMCMECSPEQFEALIAFMAQR